MFDSWPKFMFFSRYVFLPVRKMAFYRLTYICSVYLHLLWGRTVSSLLYPQCWNSYSYLETVFIGKIRLKANAAIALSGRREQLREATLAPKGLARELLRVGLTNQVKSSILNQLLGRWQLSVVCHAIRMSEATSPFRHLPELFLSELINIRIPALLSAYSSTHLSSQ